MREKIRKRQRIWDAIFGTVMVLGFLWIAFNTTITYIPANEEERYTIVLSKSSSSRDILRDKTDGCEYIKEKGKPMRPLIIDGEHVCDPEGN